MLQFFSLQHSNIVITKNSTRRFIHFWIDPQFLMPCVRMKRFRFSCRTRVNSMWPRHHCTRWATVWPCHAPTNRVRIHHRDWPDEVWPRICVQLPIWSKQMISMLVKCSTIRVNHRRQSLQWLRRTVMAVLLREKHTMRHDLVPVVPCSRCALHRQI